MHLYSNTRDRLSFLMIFLITSHAQHKKKKSIKLLKAILLIVTSEFFLYSLLDQSVYFYCGDFQAYKTTFLTALYKYYILFKIK